MNRSRVCFVAFLSFALIVITSRSIAQALSPTQRVIKAVGRVRSAKGENARVDAAEELRNLILATEPDRIDDTTIRAVASLLEVRNKAVHYWVAESLGHFGVRSRFAAPKLLALLEAQECLVAETSSASMIRDTLERIGEPAPERKCDHHIVPQ